MINYKRAIEGDLLYLHWLMPQEMPNALNIWFINEIIFFNHFILTDYHFFRSSLALLKGLFFGQKVYSHLEIIILMVIIYLLLLPS